LHRKAKDLLRSSRLPLLPATNVHVANDLAKVHDGEMPSPVLLVRCNLLTGEPLTVADGYHRNILCRLVDLSRQGGGALP
jgi:hypothetical protein